jgi:hypothetical protein
MGRNAERPRSGEQPLVVAGELHGLPARADELDRREMQGVKRADRDRKGIEGAREDRRSEVQQRYAGNQAAGLFSVRASEAIGVNAIENLVFEKTARRGRLPRAHGMGSGSRREDAPTRPSCRRRSRKNAFMVDAHGLTWARRSRLIGPVPLEILHQLVEGDNRLPRWDDAGSFRRREPTFPHPLRDEIIG